jgi:hypothetical protein
VVPAVQLLPPDDAKSLQSLDAIQSLCPADIDHKIGHYRDQSEGRSGPRAQFRTMPMDRTLHSRRMGGRVSTVVAASSTAPRQW